MEESFSHAHNTQSEENAVFFSWREPMGVACWIIIIIARAGWCATSNSLVTNVWYPPELFYYTLVRSTSSKAGTIIFSNKWSIICAVRPLKINGNWPRRVAGEWAQANTWIGKECFLPHRVRASMKHFHLNLASPCAGGRPCLIFELVLVQ